jgi:HEAT repeat protein
VANLERFLSDLTSGDDGRAEKALERITELDSAALPALLELQQSNNPDARWWATVALSKIPHARCQDALCQALSDSDGGIQQAAALGLREQPTARAIPSLIALLGDQDRILARLASNALAALGSVAVSPLTIALRNENPQIRIEAARALSQIKDTAAIPALFAALTDPSTMVAYWAEEGLNRQGVGMVFFEP